MRIISGILRHRILEEIPSSQTRSTKDRVKESMFNMLTPLTHYTLCLDLFAGSGALGIEAISRGSSFCDFVEKNHQAYQVLVRNISHLNIVSITMTFKQNAFDFLSKTKKAYDLIILDPPYHEDLISKSLPLITTNNLLSKTGKIVTLSHKTETIIVPKSIKSVKERQIGVTNVTFYEWSD